MKRAILIYQNQKFPYIFEAASDNEVQLIVINKPGEEYQQSYNSVIHSEVVDIFSDTDRPDEVISGLVEKFNASLIITCRDEAIPFTAKLAEQLNIRYVNTASADNLRSKSTMRSLITDTDFCPFYCDVPNEDFLDSISDKFPVILKPSSGYGSMGVMLVNNLEEAKSTFRKISQMNKNLLRKECASNGREITGTLAEEYIDGEEYIVDSFSIASKHKVLSIASKGKIEGPTFEETYHATNPPLACNLINDIYTCVNTVLGAVGHIDGPTHMEIRIKDNKPYVIECAARIGGGGICHYLVKDSTGIDFLKLIIDLAAGDDSYFNGLPDTPIYKNSSLNYNLRVGKSGGTYNGIEGINRLASEPDFRRILYVAPKGKVFLPYPSFSGFPGFIQSSHNSYEDALDFINCIERNIEINYKDK